MSLTLKEKYEIFFGEPELYIDFLVSLDKVKEEIEDVYKIPINVTHRLVNGKLEFNVNNQIFIVEEMTVLFIFVVEDIYGQLGLLVVNPNDTEGIYTATAIILAKGKAWVLEDAKKELSELIMDSRAGINVLGYKTRTGRMKEI